MQLRDLILRQFQPSIVPHLVEFGKHISRIEADILLFMARKSLCLYDVLLAIGSPASERCVVSDRTLDFRTEPFRGKQVALIDDTLIVGTTLAKTKRMLEAEAGANTTVHVFCVDKEWWCPELATPDNRPLYLSDADVMTFCTAQVRAMSLLPRPYLV